MTVRCIVIAIVVILQLSDTVKCGDKVKNDEEKQTFMNIDTELQPFPRTLSNDNEFETRSFSDVFKVKESNADFKDETFQRGCGNSLCAFFKNHRVIRQAGYSQVYPQLPTSYPYRLPNGTYQYNTRQPSNQFGSNSYPSYPKPVVPITPYQNPPINRPVYNSSFTHFPNSNISHYNSAYPQNSRHTYPPSPRPPNNQPLPNYRANTTSGRSIVNTTYPYNINPPTNFFGNVSKPGYPNSYPRSNFTNYNTTTNYMKPYNYPSQGPNSHQIIPNNTYPQPNPFSSGQLVNNSRPNYNGFHTIPISNFNKTFNGYQSPNGSYYDGKNGFNNSYYKPQTNYSYGTPTIPNHRNYAVNNSFGNDRNTFQAPFGGNNYYPTNNNKGFTNNVNQSLHNPYQLTSTNRPQTPYNSYIPQYNASTEPNHFYYVPNNNTSQYDPRKHPPERFNY